MRWAATLSLILLPFAAQAQEVFGFATIDGRDVVLYTDNSWEYAARDDETECEIIARNVDFCGGQVGWERTLEPNADIAATYRYDDRHYGQMIVEELGTKDGLTEDVMMQIVLDNAVAVIGGTPADVRTLETFWSRVANQRIQTIVYAFNIDGLDVVYANGIRTAPDRTMQLMTFSIGTEFTDRHRNLHEDFLSEIRITK